MATTKKGKEKVLTLTSESVPKMVAPKNKYPILWDAALNRPAKHEWTHSKYFGWSDSFEYQHYFKSLESKAKPRLFGTNFTRIDV